MPGNGGIGGKSKVVVAGVVAVGKLVIFRNWGANHQVAIVKISIGIVECGIAQ